MAILFSVNLAMDIPDLVSNTNNLTNCRYNSNMTAAEINYFLACDQTCRYKQLILYYICMILVCLLAGFALLFTGRRVSLGIITISIWLISLGNDLVRFAPCGSSRMLACSLHA